ncbi:MAG TPA: heme o synthase [Bacteroidia bacterium]|nr:heme o synthase [Bacteroidia bacterium]
MESLATNIQSPAVKYSKLSGYLKLGKLRLSSLVVFSAVISYFTVAEEAQWERALALLAGGLLVTASANGFNQIFEKDLDKLMERTKLRPMPTEVLTYPEAIGFCSLAGIGGTLLLWIYTNPLSGILGLLSIFLYALVYTPLKRLTPFSVFVGAFPGALPTLIGGVASTAGFGQVGFFAGLLFLIQFVWQFPHFWSLAWFNNEDYARANFHLLPSRQGKDAFSKFQILLYSAFLLVVSSLPFAFHYVGLISTLVAVFCGLALLLQAYNFYRVSSDANARKLFMVTLIYLPLVQVALMTKY